MAEKEKWGSGLGEEEPKGEEERRKTNGTEGWRGRCQEGHMVERWGLNEVYGERPGEKGRPRVKAQWQAKRKRMHANMV